MKNADPISIALTVARTSTRGSNDDDEDDDEDTFDAFDDDDVSTTWSSSDPSDVPVPIASRASDRRREPRAGRPRRRAVTATLERVDDVKVDDVDIIARRKVSKILCCHAPFSRRRFRRRPGENNTHDDDEG
jgi:hypothetical protein